MELMWLFRRVMSDRRSVSEEREVLKEALREAVQQAETEALSSLLRKLNKAFQEYFGASETVEEQQERAKRIRQLTRKEMSLHASAVGRRLEKTVESISDLQILSSLDTPDSGADDRADDRSTGEA